MSNSHVFISHSSKDAPLVKHLREALEGLGIPTWISSRELAGGSKLEPDIERAIEGARCFVVVLSLNTINSPWVRKEIRKALEVEQRRKDEGYRVVPLLLPGIDPQALALWFDEEPVGVRVEVTRAGGLSEAMPAILAALGEQLPDDVQKAADVAPPPVEELILELQDLRMETSGEGRRAQAIARLIYEPFDKTARRVESRRYAFTAPTGVIEAEDLRWYLEDYFFWPVGTFKDRAERIEGQLPMWGQSLYQSALSFIAAQEALTAWLQAGERSERRFSIFVERELPEGTSEEDQASSSEAAAELLALPWELLHDGRGYLFHGKGAVRVRRRLPNRHRQPTRPTRLPLRVLVVSPRPEEEGIGYIDHRVSALPLVEAFESLGDLAHLTVLAPPTFDALEQALRSADEAGEPYDVVHFDGHGVYDRKVGLGALCFEDPNDVGKSAGRATVLVHAERLAEVVRGYRVPLVFLEACQSAKTENDPTASVAARLLEEGVASVVAMSHTVLVETARRFVAAFYGELARATRVGTAMIAGQRDLHNDPNRGRMLGAGELRLQDWFVPVLYQEEQDPQLVTRLPPEQVRRLNERRRRLSLGGLPEPPAHAFIGRSRELLALERLLTLDPWVVIRGQGGEGKTTLAAELARWLVRTGRFSRAAFVRLDHYADARGVLDSLGRQLLPEGDGWSVANYPDLERALHPVERALRDREAIIVLDNLESVLPDRDGRPPIGAAPIEELFDLCRRFLVASPATRLVFTTREPLPASFDDRLKEVLLGALSHEDAVRLVGEVMKREGLKPRADDAGSDSSEITELVEAVGRHARALVLLSREVARSGVKATANDLHQLMDNIHRRFPGDRENSLYASVELSLRRLSPENRERVKVLAMFHGGAHQFVLGQLIKAGREEARSLARQLIEVGLAQHISDGHFRLDPALPLYLLREMTEEEREAARYTWAGLTAALAGFLYRQLTKDAGLATRLTLLELPNLLAMLRYVEEKESPEAVAIVAQQAEKIFAVVGSAQAQAEARGVRERAVSKLGEWGHARCRAGFSEVERLLDSGEVQAVQEASGQMLEQCLRAGDMAYAEAPYDLAFAYFLHGKVLERCGVAGDALSLLGEALRRYEKLLEHGDAGTPHMILLVHTEIAVCLFDLGRLDEAASIYEDCGKRAQEQGNRHLTAVTKAQLGHIRFKQGRYDEALATYEEARETFEALNKPGDVAAAWHMIGTVHKEAGRYSEAERAFKQTLIISVRQQNLATEATTLTELGSLYDMVGRPAEAVNLFRQAGDIYVKLKDDLNEGFVRSNLALALINLQHYDEARHELRRAMECKERFGHVAEPWKTWGILHKVELATGNAAEAARVRRQGYESYLAYRRDGGQSATKGANLCALALEAITRGNTLALEQRLAGLMRAGDPSQLSTLFPKVLAVLQGVRDPELAEDENLSLTDAVELLLLLESLGSV